MSHLVNDVANIACALANAKREVDYAQQRKSTAIGELRATMERNYVEKHPEGEHPIARAIRALAALYEAEQLVASFLDGARINGSFDDVAAMLLEVVGEKIA